jgi:hypothetical protein
MTMRPSGQRKQVEAAYSLNQCGSDCRTHYRAQRSTDADKTEQAFPLLGAEHIHHESPEHRYHEEIEDTGPNRKDPPNPHPDAPLKSPS